MAFDGSADNETGEIRSLQYKTDKYLYRVPVRATYIAHVGRKMKFGGSYRPKLSQFCAIKIGPTNLQYIFRFRFTGIVAFYGRLQQRNKQSVTP